jgi:rhodanese-related sulfurtransferase
MFFKKTPSITTQDLEHKLSELPQIVDVREPYEFSAGHIRGAKNVPLGRIKEYKPKGTVYVICQSGMRSSRATKQLRAAGIDAVNVKGGMMSWRGTVKR